MRSWLFPGYIASTTGGGYTKQAIQQEFPRFSKRRQFEQQGSCRKMAQPKQHRPHHATTRHAAISLRVSPAEPRHQRHHSQRANRSSVIPPYDNTARNPARVRMSPSDWILDGRYDRVGKSRPTIKQEDNGAEQHGHRQAGSWIDGTSNYPAQQPRAQANRMGQPEAGGNADGQQRQWLIEGEDKQCRHRDAAALRDTLRQR